MENLYALLSNQGTACVETTLTENEFNDPTRRRAADSRAKHTQGADAPIPETWCDVSENDACRDYVYGGNDA